LGENPSAGLKDLTLLLMSSQKIKN
jgi:hypothetical protein